MAGFDISYYIGDTVKDAKIKLYRDIKINTTGKKWFVEFKHLVPLELRPKYENRKWLRIKVYKGINLIKTEEYAKVVYKAVKRWLEDGFSPFEMDIEAIKIKNGNQPKAWDAQQAIHYFKQQWEKRGLEPRSWIKYERTADRFVQWLRKKDLQDIPADKITSEIIETHLYELKDENQWSNATFNGELGFMQTILNFLHSKKIMQEIKTPGKLKSKSRKHRYYDDRTYDRVKKVLLEKDPYTFFACQVVYYSCVRSEEELKSLKVGNIFPDRMQILLSEGKTGERYIPLQKELLNIFKERKIFDYPSEYYVFAVKDKNKFLPDGHPGPNPFGKCFFSNRFSRLRKEMKVSQDYTIYGMKHTRVIHLKNDGARDADIMGLTGHKTYDAFAKYLRDLGLTADPMELQQKTRKI